MTDDKRAYVEGNGIPEAFEDYYLVLLSHGPNRIDPQTDDEKAALDNAQLRHLNLLKQLYVDDLSLGAGPFKDGQGGLILIRGDRIAVDELNARLANDPHIQSGRLVATIRPFILPKGLLPANNFDQEET